jgi:polysaccharide pyruvyl transferase WcaK-like protein
VFPERTALILNFTGNTYHWGCFGTSYEIYQTLLERGYAPSFLSVNAMHALRPAPQGIEEMLSRPFAVQMTNAHPFIRTAITETDLIVVNGEGTLHRESPGPLNLLFFMHAARAYFDKPVHLINHSFYPSGGREPSETADAMYAAVATKLTRVVPREPYSLEIAKRLGVAAIQGFDCLPRFIARHKDELVPLKIGALLLSGGIAMSEQIARTIARVAGTCRNPGQKLIYLTGAKKFPASEDAKIFRWMKSEQDDIQAYNAESMEDWLDMIGGAAGMISGRFHHSLAAAALGVPFVTFPSNTPKIQATNEMLGLEPPIAYDDPALEDKLATAVRAIVTGQGRVVDESIRRRILELAEANFAGL